MTGLRNNPEDMHSHPPTILPFHSESTVNEFQFSKQDQELRQGDGILLRSTEDSKSPEISRIPKAL